MKKFLIFGAGAALGYVLGAKAGRRRYDQIVSGVSSLAENVGLASPPPDHGHVAPPLAETTGLDPALLDDPGHPGTLPPVSATGAPVEERT